jgi:hypothetical protein
LTKAGNKGAITIRPPTKDPARQEFFKLKDLMDAEFDRNRSERNGEPTTYSALFRQMATQRYALTLSTTPATAAAPTSGDLF